MELSDTIKKLRNEKGWTQARLAEEIGMPESTIGKWEYSLRQKIYFESIIKLSDAFDVSADVFRPDATEFNLPNPHFGKKDDSQEEAGPSVNGVPLRFSSYKPNARQTSILLFCEEYLNTLDDQFFTKGVGQNSEHGTGRYFWENKINLLMWMGFEPRMQEKNPDYALSIAVNTESPLPDEVLSEFNALQVQDDCMENWIYIPIRQPFSAVVERPYPEELFKAADEALFEAMKISRKELDDVMQKFLLLKADGTAAART